MKIKEIKIINQDESTEVADIGADAINVDYNETTVKDELDKLNSNLDKLNTDDDINKNNITNLQSELNTTNSNLALQTSRIDNLAHLDEGSTTGDAELIDGRIDYNGVNHIDIGTHLRNEEYVNYIYDKVLTDSITTQELPSPKTYRIGRIITTTGEIHDDTIQYSNRLGTAYSIQCRTEYTYIRSNNANLLINIWGYPEDSSTANGTRITPVYVNADRGFIIIASDNIKYYRFVLAKKDNSDFSDLEISDIANSIEVKAINIVEDITNLNDEFIKYNIINGQLYINESTQQRYIHFDTDSLIIFFNCEENVNYKINISNHNRLTIAGRLTLDNLNDTSSSRTMDNVIYAYPNDKDTPPAEIKFNSGENQTVYIYLVNGQSLSIENLKFSIEKVKNNSIIRKTMAYKSTRLALDSKLILTGPYKYQHFYLWNKNIDFGSWKNWRNYSYPELIENVYEPLRAAYPYYISRSIIGKDASNTYDIYQYTFCPDYPEQTIYLHSGVHPREEDAWITLAKIMQIICNDYDKDPALAYLRFACKIIVVPVVNVWGISANGVGQRADNNYNNINLNRDVINETQSETIAIKNFISSILENEEISFAFDFHTTVNNTYGDYMMTAWTGSKNEFLLKRSLYALARKNCTIRTESYLSKYSLSQFDLRLPYVGDSANLWTYAYWWKLLNIPCATIEHSDYVYDTDRCTEITTYLALENFLTHIINNAYAKLEVLA